MPVTWKQTVAPATEILSTADAKDFLRQTESAHDTQIDQLIVAARMWAENWTHRAFINQSWAYYLHRVFPSAREIRLPVPPLSSVSSVQYVDPEGNTKTYASSNYYVDTNSEPGRIVLDDGASWPDTADRPNIGTVTFVAGYGTSATDVPEAVRLAVRQLVFHWYDNPSPVVVGTIASNVPHTAEQLLWQYRHWYY